VVVDKGVEAAGLNQPLSRSPKLKELLSTVSGDLLTATLDRAIDDRRTAVALGTIRALGDRLELQASRPKTNGTAALVRALNYPDRRVQFAAVDTILRLPGPAVAQATVRIPEILRRIVQADPGSKVIIADFNQDRAFLVAKAVKECGYEPIVLKTGRQVLARLAEAADVDAIIVDHELPDPGMRALLALLRADIDTAQLPLFITVPPLAVGQRPAESVIPLQRMVDPYRNVFIVAASNDAELLKPMLDGRIAASTGKPFTEEERKGTMAEAMVWLRRLALGEVPGYSARAAEPAILKAMRSEELGALAVEAAGHLPGRNAQRELATVVLDEAVRAEVRASAAVELARHIQANRLVLPKNQIVALENIFNKSEDGRLKANVALVIGAMRPDLYKTGDRLKAFVPLPAAPGDKPEPGKEKMPKDKAMEKEKMDKEKDKEKADKEKDKAP
jgi:CheY-like chemotaxis protein